MKAGLALGLQLCLVSVILTSSVIIPRGPRNEGGGDQFRSKQCTEQNWPSCSNDEWGPKCPSGCRMQGLINIENEKNAEKIKEIRQMLESYSAIFKKTHISVNEAVNKIRQTLNGLGGYGNTYNQLVEHLNSRLTILQASVNNQIVELNQIKFMLMEQFKKVTRLEVDIDMKIRACKGSCKQAFTYNINREQDASMEKNFRAVVYTNLEKIQYGRTTRIFKMKPIKEDVKDTHYKSVSLVEPLSKTQKQYPEFWKEIAAHTYILESNTADTSVSPTSGGVVSNRKEASPIHSVAGSHADMTGSSDRSSFVHFYDTQRFNFTKGIGHGSFFETFSKNMSEMSFSRPHYIEEFIKGIGGKGSVTKTSVTTVTRTSESQHSKNSGTKSNSFHNIFDHRMIDTNNGDSGVDFLIREGETSSLHSPLTQKGGVSTSHRTIITEQSKGGFTKVFKSSSGTNPARLSDDETGESDPGSYLLHS